MKIIRTTAVTLLATTALAHAGGIERSDQSMAILFEEGTYAELSFSHVMPDTSGTLGVSSGSVIPSFNNVALRFRQDFTESLSFAIVLENHVGADVDYPAGNGYALAGTNAELNGESLTAVLRYEFPTGMSIYGGARLATINGDVTIQTAAPLPAGIYTLSTNTDSAVGYLIGASYEIPEIALRVNLTYNSSYTHDLTANDAIIGVTTATSSIEVEVPQSLMLEAQSGIAEDTLLFGSIRWVDWTAFEVDTALYQAFVGGGPPLVGYNSDRITYEIGVARRFTDEWVGAITATYEPETNDVDS
ncbi:MAG: hypothetical protein AAF914_07980, partial [Pseudomonadota bacterium]